MTTLADAVAAEGYRLIIDPEPSRRPDIVGNPPDPHTFDALLCADRTIACRSDSWDHAYSVSHEIAEHRRGHTHDQTDVYCEQANLLAKWLRELAPTGGGGA